MPPKKIKYPRYFRSVDPAFHDCLIIFPGQGSLGTVYYTKSKRWGTPQWKLSEMAHDPADVEIAEHAAANRWQRIALGIPDELPPYKAEPKEKEELGAKFKSKCSG